MLFQASARKNRVAVANKAIMLKSEYESAGNSNTLPRLTLNASPRRSTEVFRRVLVVKVTGSATESRQSGKGMFGRGMETYGFESSIPLP